MFDPDELAEIERLAAQAEHDGRAESARLLKGVLAKLRGLAGPAAEGPMPLFEEVLPPAARTPDPATAARVRAALERQERLRIRYRANRSGEVTVRRIRPFNIHFYDGQEYVEAYCELRASDRIFALANVEAVLDDEATAASPDAGGAAA